MAIAGIRAADQTLLAGRLLLYRYSARHDANGVDPMLAGYRGYCWAHARRYFFKALESEPERARQALALIGELFRIERQLAEAPVDAREQVRRRESRRVVERIFAWCEATVVQALDETPLAKGLRYALNQRSALVRFLEDGRLPIHNNHSEQGVRREAVGRKNWDLHRQGRCRQGQRLVRIAPRQLPAAWYRTVGLPARPVLPSSPAATRQ
jgi:hypothetical protein